MTTASATAHIPDSCDSDVSPYDKSSFLHRLSFAWANPLLSLGMRKSLQQTEIYPVPEKARSAALLKSFSHHLSLNNNGLFATLWSLFGAKWMAFGMLKMVKDFASLFILIYLFPHLLSSISSGASHWVVLRCIASLFVMQIVGCISVNTYFFNVMHIGFRARVAITNLLFKKGLSLSHHFQSKYSSANVISMIFNDCSKIEVAAGYAHYLWSGLILIAAIIWFLQHTLGWLPVIGILVVFVMIPVQSFMVKKISKIKVTASGFTDQRLKATAELVEGIRLIKFYNWVRPFFNKINEMRIKELTLYQRLKTIKSLTYCLTLCLPIISILITFAIYLQKHPTPNYQRILTAYSAMIVIQFVLLLYPMCINMVGEAVAAVFRIQSFINYVESSLFKPKAVDNIGVYLHNVSSSWIDSIEPTGQSASIINTQQNESAQLQQLPSQGNTFYFHNLSLEFPHASLTIICGKVGSGKSSLLNVIVGELPCKKGSVYLEGSIGYCSQVPWIQNKTVKENIVFGRAFNLKRYQKALYLSALDHDLDTFASGDETEIGERGVNLSGGQKQRIAIARLIYSDPDIVVMDDPFAAVDASVGNFIFNNLIMDYFLNKTRIIATHRMQFAAKCAQVVFMEEGQPISSGSFEQMLENESFNSLFMRVKSTFSVSNSPVKNHSGKADTHSPGTPTPSLRKRPC